MHQIHAPTSEGRQKDERFVRPVSVTSTMTGSSVGFVKGIAMEALEPIGDEMLTASILLGLRPHPDRSTHHSCNYRHRWIQTRKMARGCESKNKEEKA